MLLGIVGLIWSVHWWHFSYERPAIHPKISEEERVYIEESIGEACSISNKVEREKRRKTNDDKNNK